MPKKTIVLDFETLYDDEYSLRKMSPAEYILDPKFETIMVAVKELGAPKSDIIEGPDFPRWLGQYNPSDTTTITFNALFDNAILAWRYGFVPETMIDCLGMARALLGAELRRFSLNAVSEYLGTGGKVQGTLESVKGMGYAAIKGDPHCWGAMSIYAARDNDLCEADFLALAGRFPWSERRLMDMVLRACIVPRFHTDVALLRQHLSDLAVEKQNLLSQANVDKTTLMSTPKFKALLESMGVTVGMKTSPTTGKLTPAFARTDAFIQECLEHPDTRVQAVTAARLGHRSTIEETRAQRLLDVASLPWPQGVPVMPIPLRYGGAHTHRLSGDWKMNMQNMPTARGSGGKSKLRQSLRAPPGHKIIVADLGQIEARLVAWLCNAANLLDEFARKLDPYSLLAQAIFGRPINRKLVGTPDEVMGFIGKTGILGLGYGAGKDKFDTMVQQSARKMAVDLALVNYTKIVGDRAVDTYRRKYSAIPNGWYTLDRLLKDFWLVPGRRTSWGGTTNVVHISYGKVELPNGLCLNYNDPQQDASGELIYRYGNETHKIYGAKFLENITQTLARIVVMNAALRIRDRGKVYDPTAYSFAMQAHDELVYIVPDAEVDRAKAIIHEEMTRRPSWAPELPLTADVGVGDTYAEAK